MADLTLKDYENLILQSIDQVEQQDTDASTKAIMSKTKEDRKNFLTTFYESLVAKTSEATASNMPKERVQKIVPDPAVVDEFMLAGEGMSRAYQDALMSGLEDTYKMREDEGIIRSLGPDGLSVVGERPMTKEEQKRFAPIENTPIETEELVDTDTFITTSLRPKPRPAGLFTKPDEITESLRPKIRPEKEETFTSLRPKIRPEEIQQVETTKEVIKKVSNTLPTVQNPLTFIFKQGIVGLDENNKAHQDSIKGFLNTAVPGFVGNKSEVTSSKKAWCGAFVNHVLKNLGADVLNTKDPYDKLRAKKYEDYGEEVSGINNAKPGDLVIIKNKDTFHVSFFTSRSKDGQTINALGGNQNNKVQVSEYKPSQIVAIRRIGNIEDVDTETIKSLTVDIAEGDSTR